MKVTLLIATLNEIDGMRAIMPRIKKEWVDQLIILDGGSTDGTIEYAKEHGYFIFHQKEKGLRKGYREVWPSIEGDVVLTFSPDGNSVPEVIPLVLEKMKEGYDMVLASRYLDGARSEDDTLLTGFGNWFFTKLTNWLYGSQYTDYGGIFRAYRTGLMRELELDKDEGYALLEKIFFTKVSWEPLLSVRAAKKKIKIAEVPGDEPPRLGGVKKMKTFRWGAVFLCQIIGEKMRG